MDNSKLCDTIMDCAGGQDEKRHHCCECSAVPSRSVPSHPVPSRPVWWEREGAGGGWGEGERAADTAPWRRELTE